MTKRELTAALGKWQQRLGLEHWRVDIDFNTPPPPESDAAICHYNSYDRATVMLAAGWEKWDRVLANQTLVHELLHLHTRDIEQSHFAIENHLHPDAWSVHARHFDHELEGLVERLAIRFVEVGGCA